MHNRLRLLTGATALLYMGPLLAGLGGFGWNVVPVFTGIFILWLIILRPKQWPRSLADWKNPTKLVKCLSQSAVQLLLVTLCFGIGRGLGGVMGALPPFPLMLPIAVSFLSIPLARIIWDPWKTHDVDEFQEAAPPQNAGKPTPDRAEKAGVVAELLKPVQDLQGDVPELELERHLRAIRIYVDHDDLREGLLTAARSGKSTLSGLKALIIHATDPATVDMLGGKTYLRDAFVAARTNDALLALFARRCALALVQEPEAWWDCPSAEQIERAARDVTNAETLRALRDLVSIMAKLAPAGQAQGNAG